MGKVFPVLIVLAFVALLPVYAQSVEIIVHPDNDITSVTKAELSKIFLKRLRTWADGTLVVPVDQVPDSSPRREFTRSVHERRVVNVEVYWKRMIFSGRAAPPPEMADDLSVIEFVRNTPGAVGYVSKLTRLEGVRALKVTD